MTFIAIGGPSDISAVVPGYYRIPGTVLCGIIGGDLAILEKILPHGRSVAFEPDLFKSGGLSKTGIPDLLHTGRNMQRFQLRTFREYCIPKIDNILRNYDFLQITGLREDEVLDSR